MSEARSAVRPGVVVLLAAGILWGGGGPSGRMLAETSTLAALPVASFRALVGGAGLLLLTTALGRFRLRGRAAWRRVLLSAALVAAYQGCYFAAVAGGSVSLATLVTVGSAPVLVTVIESLRGRHSFGYAGGLVLVLAPTGLVLLVGWPGPGVTDVWRVVGLSLVAGASFARLTILNNTQIREADLLTLTGATFFTAGLALGALALAGPGFAGHWGTGTFGWILVLGVVATAAPYGLYFTGLTMESATMASLAALFEPLTATLLASVFFGERLTALGWLGAALLLSGVVAAAVTHRPQDPPPALP